MPNECHHPDHADGEVAPIGDRDGEDSLYRIRVEDWAGLLTKRDICVESVVRGHRVTDLRDTVRRP